MANPPQAQPARSQDTPPPIKAKSSTTPKENKQGKVVPVPVPKLTDLPGYMDPLGWKISAILMRKWFAADARAMTLDEKLGKTSPASYPPALVDTTSVTLEWVLTFERVNKLYKKFLDFSFFGPYGFDSEKARLQIARRIKRAGLFTERKQTFGDLAQPATAQHEHWQFTFFRVDVGLVDRGAVYVSGLDDLFGALAGFGVYLAAYGSVTPTLVEVGTAKAPKQSVTKYDVELTHVVVYARDTYDFIGDQYLGHWSKSGPVVDQRYFAADQMGSISPKSYQPYYDGTELKFPVGNWNFNEYRTRHKKGGDLLIFTNTRRLRLNRPIRFTLTAQQVAAMK